MPATRRAPLGGGKPPPPAPGDLAAAATAAATKAIAAANAAQRAALRAAFATRERTISPSPSLGCVEGGAAAVAPSEEGGGGLTPSRRASAAPSSSPGSAAPPPAPPPLGPSDAAAAAASAVSARYPGREGQVRALSAALGLPNDWPRHVLVHGPPSVGKTAVVRDLLAASGRRHVYIKCAASMPTKALARQLLDALKGRKRRRANGYAPDLRLDSVSDLAEFLAPAPPPVAAPGGRAQGGGGAVAAAAATAAALPAVSSLPFPPTWVVLDDVDALAALITPGSAGAAGSGVDGVAAIARALEAAGAPVGLILIAPPGWAAAAGGAGGSWASAAGPAGPPPPPTSIPFPAYAPGELLSILARDGPAAGEPVPGLPPGADGPALFAGMVRGCVLPGFGRDDVGVAALRAAAAWLWPRWLGPAVAAAASGGAGVAARLTEGALNAAARPLMRAAREALDAGRPLPPAGGGGGGGGTKAGGAPAGSTAASAGAALGALGLDLELPYLTKFLVLASHIAGCTPPSADRRTFDAAFRGGRRRAATARVAASRADARAAAAGGRDPVAFSLERLLSIFWHLVAAEGGGDGRGGPGAAAQAGDVLTSVSSLASLGLLAREPGGGSGPGAALEGGRYSSLVSDELARRVAANVRVDLRAYTPA